MIARLLLQNTVLTAGMGALLFAAAGTLHWPGAWVFLLTSVLLGPLCGWWLYRIDPALLAERLRPLLQKDQPAADKVFMGAQTYEGFQEILGGLLDPKAAPKAGAVAAAPAEGGTCGS